MRKPSRLLPLLLYLAPIACAQSTFGVILGVVRDSSGAAVPAASIRLTNVGENTSRDVQASAEGDYEFQNVKPGTYSVAVNHPGFRNFRTTELTLVARQTLRVDVRLEVGEVTETV